LNETGKVQVCKLGEHLKSIALDNVFASDLQRAVDTAHAIAQPHGLQVELDSRLREWDVGDLDGQPAVIYLKMIKDTGKPLSFFDPPGGTKLGEVRKRADGFIEQLLREHLGESVVACSHGDFMRMMIGSMLQIDIDTATAFHFDNASYSVFEFLDDHWRVIAINRIVIDGD